MLRLLLALLSLFPAAPATLCYEPPVSGPISRPFIVSSCVYCPGGHRGVEYQTQVGTPIHAVQVGFVSFVGLVAGTNFLVVDQPEGLRATYGHWVSSPLRRGDRVVAGQVVASSSGTVYFGLRRGDVYLDPATMLGIRRYRPRLVPLDGTAPRPPQRGSLECA